MPVIERQNWPFYSLTHSIGGNKVYCSFFLSLGGGLLARCGEAC